MPSAKNDAYKRKCAQALNHLSEAVIDMNAVFEAFDQSITRMNDSAIELGQQPDEEAIGRYQDYKNRLKTAMMFIMVPREQIVVLIGEMWGLDEESIKVYLG